MAMPLYKYSKPLYSRHVQGYVTELLTLVILLHMPLEINSLRDHDNKVFENNKPDSNVRIGGDAWHNEKRSVYGVESNNINEQNGNLESNAFDDKINNNGQVNNNGPLILRKNYAEDSIGNKKIFLESVVENQQMDDIHNKDEKKRKKKRRVKKISNDTLKFNEIPRNGDSIIQVEKQSRAGDVGELPVGNTGANGASNVDVMSNNRRINDEYAVKQINRESRGIENDNALIGKDRKELSHDAHGNSIEGIQNGNTGAYEAVKGDQTGMFGQQRKIDRINGANTGVHGDPDSNVHQVVQVVDSVVDAPKKRKTTKSPYTNQSTFHGSDNDATRNNPTGVENKNIKNTYQNNENNGGDKNQQANEFENNNNLPKEFPHLNSDFKYERRQDDESKPVKKNGIIKGNARPPVSQKKDVVWFEEYHSFSLRASIDNRFRIRHAPIPAEGSPWPLPQFYRPESKQFIIKPLNFKFYAAGETCDILEYQFERLKKNIFGPEEPNISHAEVQGNFRFFRESEDPFSEIKYLNVTVLKECGTIPQLDMDESYDLEIRKTGAVIISREVWGAIRGLETFGQLVHQDLQDRFLVNKTLIHDFPRFKHRGMLLDTSRHYLNKETIILNLEALAQNKMNVFHWHIVDEQSFPFDSQVFPNLTKMGAYSQSHIYTHQVIRQIIDEARLRGIRVVPEFDTPGHTLAWGYGVDNLLTPCYDYSGKPDGYFGPINPILKSTYRFLDGLLNEVMELFEDKYVHLGGDEVPLDCWQSNPFLQRFMSRNKLYDIKELLNVYEKKLIDIVTNIGKKRKTGSGYTVWQEVFDDGVDLKPDTVVQIWKGDAWDIDRVTSKGYRALFSSCWYLDYINYGQDWDKYYRCDQVGPHLDMYNVRNESLLIGGEVCLWTEYADDENILQRIWPRASAAAERLWSHKDVLDAEAAAPRIEAQRCRMKSRGIPVGVLSGPGYCQKHSKQQQPLNSLFNWIQHSDVINSDKTSAKNIYVVDMNAMYVVPLVIVVCLVCMVILSSIQQNPSQKKFLAILTLPVNGSRHGVKSLLYVFMLFAVLWCIWTAPIWLHSWENTDNQR